MIEQQSVVGHDAVVTGGAMVNGGRRRRSTRLAAGSVLAILAFSSGCTADPAAPKLTTLADVMVGGVSVHVALDDTGNVCSSVGDGLTLCVGALESSDVGVQDARLDPEPKAPLLMRVLVDPDTELVGLPVESVRVPIDAQRVLVLAVTTSSTVCFEYTKPDGTPSTVEVHATQVDTGAGVTTGADTETGCGS